MRFIDFYEKNKIIPVVDNDDIKKKIYNNQRKSFYYSIKINLSNFKGKNILELCPGTGTNAQFLLNNDNRYKFTDETLKILVHYIDQLKDFKSFANARTVKVFVNQLLAYQAIRVEKTLMDKGSIDYESLVTIQPEDFSYFTGDDFINIVGSENIELYKG